MQEEFHGDGDGIGYKRLYNWNSLTASVWLPALSELVGIDPDNYYEPYGCYYSAMQGLNTSDRYWTDAQGGSQFAYFKQYNISGGGERIWTACNQQISWLRSPDLDVTTDAWRTTNPTALNAPLVTNSYAVHPAAEESCGNNQ